MKRYILRGVCWCYCGLLVLAFAACRESKNTSNAGAFSGSISGKVTIAEVADDPIQPESGALVLALDVAGMHCKSCAEGIGEALTRAEGARRARVSFKNGCAWLLVDAQHHASVEDAARLVNELGYKAVPKLSAATASQPAS